MPSVLTEAQTDAIIAAMKYSDEMPWCSGIVKLNSGSLPLFYKTSCHPEADGVKEEVVKCVAHHLAILPTN